MVKFNRFCKILCKYALIVIIGGALYCGIEMVWRGYSHWTMALAGGISVIAIGALNDNKFEWDMPLTSQMFLSGAVVTGIELIFGLVCNVLLGMDVWDYSVIPYNFMGQICMSYFGFWQLLSPVAILLYDFTDYWLFGGDKPKYRLI